MHCCIYTADGSSIVKAKISDIEQQLAPYDFLKPHRSYLVNCQYISIIHKSDIELTNNVLVPIGRGRTDEVKKIYLQYVNRSIL